MTKQDYAEHLINKLGGTTKIARLIDSDRRTVDNWRRRGVPIKYLPFAVEQTGIPAEKFIFGDQTTIK